jgi:type I restriction enzyme S subunit
MSEWGSIKLGDLVSLTGGAPFKSSDFGDYGIPVLKIKNVKANRLLLDDVAHISEDVAQEYPESFLQKGDLLITMTGNRIGGGMDSWVGKVARFNEDRRYCLNQRIGIIRPKSPPAVDIRFLSFCLSTEDSQRELIQIATGSGGQANLSPKQILSVKVPHPPLSEQCAIAAVLGSLDDKIELNRRMNETLEALAQSLFKSWFVDATQSALPKGWSAGTLGEVAENPRRGIQPDEIKTDTAYIGLEHMPRRSIALSDWGHTEELESGKFEFKHGEILFGKLRPYFHKVGVAPLDGVCSTDILVITPKEAAWFGFVLGHVSSVELVNHTNAASTGTKMPRANWNDISRYEVALPPKQLAAEFTEKIRPLVERIIANIHESRTLAALRDALLPKLLSGELRVANAVETGGGIA